MSYQFPYIVKQIFDEKKEQRLTFYVKDHRFWWNYCDLRREPGADYPRCSDDYFPTLTDAEIDAFNRFGF